MSNEPYEASSEEQDIGGKINNNNDGDLLHSSSDTCSSQKCTLNLFMCRLLGRLRGVLNLADCPIRPGGILNLGGTKFPGLLAHFELLHMFNLHNWEWVLYSPSPSTMGVCNHLATVIV